ncbi:DEAD/DEAH box helicase [Thermococcus thermotolerans]|uniref:DEAD/DEAH box helicase n=1 Tax=Thermococcus thermotolerans TaxID=2969672 RepID=UPI00215785B6|nr:DEAD/DEAH box helicase [Thermococcus thermotolerans]
MVKFNPIETTEEIQEDYMNFFLTSFSPNNPQFMERLKEIPKRTDYLWKGPYIAIPPKPKLGGEFKEFEKNRIDDNVRDAFSYITRLYKHQEEAIRNILNGRNTIVAVPTGSGKTEVFLIPIIQYCYTHRTEKGTKAILVYPMNALAKDQVERLRKILWRINRKLPPEERITFAIYTGDTPKDKTKLKEEFQDQDISETCPLSEEDMNRLRCPKNCEKNRLKYDADNEVLYCPLNKDVVIDYQTLTRKSIQDRAPDIIITNYVQLEHILSRKEDLKWLATGSLRFIVLDEIHSYAGSKGVDVALLMRRLRREASSNPICIGTSATISKKKDDIERKNSIAEFASRIFGDIFTITDVIEAEYEEYQFPEYSFMPPYLDDFEELLDSIHDLDATDEKILDELLMKINPTFKRSHSFPASIEIGRALLGNAFFQELITRLETPKSLDEIIQELRKSPNFGNLVSSLKNEELKKIVWSYLKLGSKCKDPYNPSRPLINVNLHIFVKTVERLYQCNECGRIYTSPRDTCDEDGSAVDEIGVCRFCGHIFNIVYVSKNEFMEWYGTAKKTQKLKKNNSPILEILPKRQKRNYLKKLDYRSEFSEEAVPIWISDKPPVETDEYIEIKRCRKCGSIIDPTEDTCPVCGSKELYSAYAFVRDPKEGTDTRPISCPYCGNRYGRYSALSPVAMSSDTASVVVFDRVYTKLPEEYKKLLIFTDNRQIASYLAKHLEDTHFDHTVRVLVHYLVKQENKVYLSKLFDMAYDTVISWPYEKLRRRKMLETAILEEVCSLRGRQRSLENLGLIKVTYYGLEDEEKFKQEWLKFISELEESLISDLRLHDTNLWKEILIAIADIIRQKGAIKGLHNNPPGRTEVIGFSLAQKIEKRHVKVIGFLSKGRTKQRLLLQKIFGKTKTIDDALELAFNFLIKAKILEEVELRCCGSKKLEKATGYVINDKRIIIKKPEVVFKCNTCQRVHLTSPSSACMTYNCNGTTEPIPYREFEKYMTTHNYYFRLYQNEKPVKMITAEDTGAIPSKERHSLEMEFKKKDVEERKVDVIVATPTLELGVDIGDLISVGIYKAPPSPANYVQRVGRAGRKEKLSLNVTFLYLSPLDRYYYEKPEELIRGIFEAPKINIENRYLIQKHVNAIILYELMKSFAISVPMVFKEFSEAGTLNNIQEKVRRKRKYFIDIISRTLGIESLSTAEIDRMIDVFLWDLNNAVKSFERELKWYQAYEEKLAQKKDYEKAKKIREIVEKLERSHTISYLMDVNVLPRYAFPGTYVEIRDVYGMEDFEGRSRNIAITELAPLMRVFMKKKIYKSIGIDMEILKPKEKVFHICPRCGRYVTENKEELITYGCPVCRYKPSEHELEMSTIEPAIEPNIIYIKQERESSFQLREYQEAASRIYLAKVSNTTTRLSKVDSSLRLTRYINSEIVKVVDRVIINKEEREIKICEKCGKVLERLEEERSHYKLGTNEKCNGHFRKFVLYHRMPTNVISIQFTSDTFMGQKIDNIEEFLVTFKNALLNAAQRILYAQDGEIDGDIDLNKREILIYDNVEGGAGYSDQIYERFEEILQEAYRIASTCDCEKGCPNCLWSYWRKRDIPKIDKTLILDPLSRITTFPIEDIFNDEQLARLKQEFQCENARTTITDRIDGPMSLKKILLSATEEVYLTSLYVTDDKIVWPDGTRQSWVDILSLLALKGVNVNLIVRPPKGEKHENAIKRLRDNGVNVYIYEKETKNALFKGIIHAKIAVIDPLKGTRHVVFTSANLSPEVTKNVDFYIISEDEECTKRTLQRIRELISKSKRL